MRTRHMATLEAIRFGETMRHVAAATRTRPKVGPPRRTAAALDGTMRRWTVRNPVKQRSASTGPASSAHPSGDEIRHLRADCRR